MYVDTRLSFFLPTNKDNKKNKNDKYHRLLKHNGGYDAEDHLHLPLPDFYRHVVNVDTTHDPSAEHVLFWYIGKSGGSTFSRVLTCLEGLVQCSPKGDSTGKTIPNAPPIQVVTHADDGAKYLNMNPVSAKGIYWLAYYNAHSKADIILTPQLVKACESLFSAPLPNSNNSIQKTRGRLLVMLRHPVKREIDLFYYRQAATWDVHFDIRLATMSFRQYVHSNLMVDNVVTRTLIDLSWEEEILPHHVALAKEILRRKFLVGIFEWYPTSLNRFERYLGWWDKYHVGTNETVNQCHYRSIFLDERSQNNAAAHEENNDKKDNDNNDDDEDDHGDGGHNAAILAEQGMVPNVAPLGGELWGKLVIRLWADMEIYVYAKHLYAQQAALFMPKEEGEEEQRQQTQ